MTETRTRLLHLHYVRMSRRLIRTILKLDETLSFIYAPPNTLKSVYHLPHKHASTMHLHLQKTRMLPQFIKSIIEHETITFIDEDYPDVLKQIKDPPLVLYVLGKRRLLTEQPMISVIGSRKPTKTAWNKVAHLLPNLVDEKWTIVSGMAKGIDSYAHQLTLQRNGKTIAVLGGGFEHIYPRENVALFQAIRNNGLVVSEYPPHMRPERFHFPERNRIISGLGFGTLVIEANERSGTMITVDQALDQGREVYAVPGSIFDAQTKGCHRLIQEGAKLVLHADDIIRDWHEFGKRMYATKQENELKVD